MIMYETSLRISLQFAPLLRGNSQKVNSGLNLLALVLSSRNRKLFVILEKRHLTLCHILLDIGHTIEYSEKAFKVMIKHLFCCINMLLFVGIEVSHLY